MRNVKNVWNVWNDSIMENIRYARNVGNVRI